MSDITAKPDAAFTVTGQTVVWRCAGCGGPIRGGEGHLVVSVRAATAYDRAVARFSAEHPDGATLAEWRRADIPPLAHWAAWHARCDPAPLDNDYWIAVERADTFARLLHRSGHLAGTPWISATDWSELMMRIGDST